MAVQPESGEAGVGPARVSPAVSPASALSSHDRLAQQVAVRGGAPALRHVWSEAIGLVELRRSKEAIVNGSRFVVLSLVVVVILAAAPPAIAAHADEAIVLPGASSAEGIAKGTGSTFYAGDLLRGDIFRGDVRRGTAELFIDAPDGRMAAGMAVDVRHRLLFVAGVSTGGAYVYDTRTGATVASYQFTDQPSLINDVAISKDGAWFTDSMNPVLYHVPIGRRGTLGAFRTLDPHRTRGRHARRSQQQRHPGHAQRQGADRRAQRPGGAEPRRPVHRRKLRDRGPEPAGRRRSAACGTPPLVRGAELPQPDRRNPAQCPTTGPASCGE